MQMLLPYAGGILGHFIARKGYRWRERHMQRMEWGAFQGCLVIAQKDHGASWFPGYIPEEPVEAPSVAVPESIIPSADAQRP